MHFVYWLTVAIRKIKQHALNIFRENLKIKENSENNPEVQMNVSCVGPFLEGFKGPHQTRDLVWKDKGEMQACSLSHHHTVAKSQGSLVSLRWNRIRCV
jgi:hypothetical protein